LAEISQFSIVTYQRKPGQWRAAITPKAQTQSVNRGEVRSFVTLDDSVSESDAKFAAEKIIKKF
jgi:hypothetical protein